MPQKSGERKSAIPSFGAISKALNVLEYVGLHGETQFGTIADYVKLPKSTLHRIVSILVQEGFIARTRHGTYRGTLKLWEIGTRVTNYDAMREVIMHALRQLVDETSETAHYAIYENGWSIYVAKVDAVYAIRAGTSVGGRSPAYASATGKAVLAWRDEAEIAAIGAQAKRLTSTTITGGKALLAEAAEIRRTGIAASRGELFADLWSVAAPIHEPNGEINSAIGVAGPTVRMKENFQANAKAVAKAAAIIARRGDEAAA